MFPYFIDICNNIIFMPVKQQQTNKTMKKSTYQNFGLFFAVASAVFLLMCFFFLGAGNQPAWLLCFVTWCASVCGFIFCFEAYKEQQRKNRKF